MRAALAVPLALAACAGAAQTPPAASLVPEPTANPASPTPNQVSERSSISLNVWLAPRFVPDPNSRAEAILQEHLNAFEAAHPGTHVSIRIKAVHGPGGMVESIAAADQAAPAALPDLLTLDSSALAESTAMLADLEERFSPTDSGDWYEFGLAGSAGVPFAADVDVFAYKLAIFESPPLTWGSLFTDRGSFLIPAAQSESLFLIAQYLAMEGDLDLESEIDASVLQEVLEFISDAQAAGALSPDSLDLTNASETWLRLRSGQDGAGQVPFHDFAATFNPTVYAAGPFPTSDGRGIVLASPWFWATPTRSTGPLRDDLLDWLSDPQFLAEWSHALGAMPVRPDVLALWPDGPEAAIASRLVSVALPKPPAAVLQAYGPRFADALQAVLGGELLPLEAATQAAGAR
jgi:ABC-type glycerol-3-phosphate transport system substrate-binding protein